MCKPCCTGELVLFVAALLSSTPKSDNGELYVVVSQIGDPNIDPKSYSRIMGKP